MMCVPTVTDGNWAEEGEVSGMSQTGGESGEGRPGVGWAGRRRAAGDP